MKERRVEKVGRRIGGARSCRRAEVGETPARKKAPDALTLRMHAGVVAVWRAGRGCSATQGQSAGDFVGRV